MRMRNHHRLQPTKRPDPLDRAAVQVGDHVPQDVTVRRPQQERTLSDGEFRRCTEGGDAGVDGVGVPDVLVGAA